jgi:hypothetical protein
MGRLGGLQVNLKERVVAPREVFKVKEEPMDEEVRSSPNLVAVSWFVSRLGLEWSDD